MSVPAPCLSTEPVPLMTAAEGELSVRLKIRAALSMTLPVIEPVVPPLPICRVPAAMVVPPL